MHYCNYLGIFIEKCCSERSNIFKALKNALDLYVCLNSVLYLVQYNIPNPVASVLPYTLWIETSLPVTRPKAFKSSFPDSYRCLQFRNLPFSSFHARSRSIYCLANKYYFGALNSVSTSYTFELLCAVFSWINFNSSFSSSKWNIRGG